MQTSRWDRVANDVEISRILAGGHLIMNKKPFLSFRRRRSGVFGCNYFVGILFFDSISRGYCYIDQNQGSHTFLSFANHVDEGFSSWLLG